LIDADGQE